MTKKDTESAFSGLNEIAQDFYADRTTDVFHGITEDYVESGEEETPEDNGMEPQNQVGPFKLDQGNDCSTQIITPHWETTHQNSPTYERVLNNRGNQSGVWNA